MRLKTMLSLFVICGLASPLPAQPADTQIESVPDYENWGWTAIVQHNGLITIATVPVIGARMMQYRLGEHESIYRNPNTLGETHTPQNNNQWYNYGGFKNWPAPQSVWNWTPPPLLDYGEYDSEIRVDSPDSTMLFVRSPVEQWKAPDIRFERKSTLYKGSSRVRMDQTIINEGSSQQSWGVWDITQQIVHHPSDDDFENFWVYFPLNPESAFGDDGIYWGSSWGEPSTIQFGEVAPGIFGMQYGTEECKVFGDAPEGWICFADEGEGAIFAKTFEVFDDAVYPDNGGIVQVYFSGGGSNAWNMATAYMEVEVTGPIVDLAPNGGRYTLTENFFAAKVHGPILKVTDVGAVARALDFDDRTGNVVGRYGVFYEGTAQTLVLGTDDSVLEEGIVHAVTPLETFSLNEQIAIPEIVGARVTIEIRDDQGDFIGMLDEATVDQMSAVEAGPSAEPRRIDLVRNYPNPFNGRTTITFRLERNQSLRISVYDIRGRRQAVPASREFEAGAHSVHWDASGLPGGVYFARIEGQGIRKTVKMLLMP